MTDYFVWIDPFNEIDRAKREAQYANHRASQAREQGQKDVLDCEYRNPGLIQKCIEQQAYEIAARVVEEQIRPSFYDASRRMKIRDAALDFLSFTPTRHILSAVESEVRPAPLWDEKPREFGIVTEVYMKPFYYAVMDPLA